MKNTFNKLLKLNKLTTNINQFKKLQSIKLFTTKDKNSDHKSTHINDSGINYDKVSDAEGTAKHSYYNETMRTGFDNAKVGDYSVDRAVHNKNAVNKDKQDLTFEGTNNKERDFKTENIVNDINVSEFEANDNKGAKEGDYFGHNKPAMVGKKPAADAIYDRSQKHELEEKIVEASSDKGPQSNENFNNKKHETMTMATAKKGRSSNDAKPDLDTENDSQLNLTPAKTEDTKTKAEKNTKI